MYHDHRQSVSIAGDGIEIGRLQIHLDEKRTSHIKSQILEARLDESASLADTGIGKNETKGWKILRQSLSKESRHSVQQGMPGSGLQVRNSKLSLGGRGSKLSLGPGPPRGSKLCIRNSTCHIIQEEGSDSNDAKKEGWKVLRQSIQRKQLHEDLQVRKSTLKLHTMDECAVNRSSQISFKRHSVLSQLQNQPTHPAIQTMYRRKSSAFSDATDNNSIPSEISIKSKYGYSEMSVATHRRRSTVHELTMSDVQMVQGKISHQSKPMGCCPWKRLKIRLNGVYQSAA